MEPQSHIYSSPFVVPSVYSILCHFCTVTSNTARNQYLLRYKLKIDVGLRLCCELWRDLLTSIGVAGELDFGKDKLSGVISL